jgi:cysteine desulfurase
LRGWGLSAKIIPDQPVIYLDHNATTPVLPEVFEAMRPYFCEEWGNPSSAYKFGSKIKGVIETARAQVAELIGAQPREIVFTSCATESNNAAIHAVLKANPSKRHIVTSPVEHSSVLNYCKALEKDGYQVSYLPVDRDGLLTLADLENAITGETADAGKQGDEGTVSGGGDCAHLPVSERVLSLRCGAGGRKHHSRVLSDYVC